MFIPPSSAEELLQLPEFYWGIAAIIVVIVGASVVPFSPSGYPTLVVGLMMCISELGSIGYLNHRIVRDFFPPLPIFSAFGILLLVAGVQSALIWPWMWTTWATLIAAISSLYGSYRKYSFLIL